MISVIDIMIQYMDWISFEHGISQILTIFFNVTYNFCGYSYKVDSVYSADIFAFIATINFVSYSEFPYLDFWESVYNSSGVFTLLYLR